MLFTAQCKLNWKLTAQCKLNWKHAKLRRKTCVDGSIMLPFATLKIVYWQSMPAAQ
jgi:hypothetical protein